MRNNPDLYDAEESEFSDWDEFEIPWVREYLSASATINLLVYQLVSWPKIITVKIHATAKLVTSGLLLVG